MTELKRRAYMAYFVATCVGVLTLAGSLPYLDDTTRRVVEAIVPVSLVFVGSCFVVLWRRPALLRLVEVMQYAACYPFFLGLLALLLANATSETSAHASIAAFAVWIPIATCWSFIVFGSRRGPYASLTFLVAAGAVVATYLAGGVAIGSSGIMFVILAVVAGGVFVVLLYALTYLLERQTASRIAAEVAAEYAVTDVLTGAYTRFALGLRLDQALSLARRTDRRLAVALLDLDDFKPVNDDLGHAAGDEVLRVIATRLTTAVRDADTVARLGGDEFVVLAFVDDPSAARLVAERIVASTDAPIPVNGFEARVGASVGVSLFPDDADTAEGLLAAADAAMYTAKAAGKRRVALASQALPIPLAPPSSRPPSASTRPS